MTEAQKQREWHLDRRVTIGLIVTLLIHAGASIWWASSLTTRVDQIEEKQSSTTEIPQRMVRVETQVQEIRDYLRRMDGKLDRLIEKN